MPRLRVIADDLTGACDVGAALVPWPGGVAVVPFEGRDGGVAAVGVRNTQSRTLTRDAAVARVAAALADVEPGFDGILLKKIDTGLRGHLGAELDAAMDAVGAAEAFVLPAIPEVGRTTERGHQLIEGVPVHETAFGRDPQNPVTDSEVAAVIASTSRRRAAAIHLDAVRGEGLGAAVDAARAQGASVLVCDACTGDDLARAVRVLLRRPRPLVLAGSIGLAAALRDALVAAEEGVQPGGRGELPLARGLPPTAREAHAPVRDVPNADSGGRGARRDARVPPAAIQDGAFPPDAAGTLIVLGSAHPRAHTLLARAERSGLLTVIEVADEADAPRAARAAVALLADGRRAALVVPTRPLASDAVLSSLRSAAGAVLDVHRPRGLVMVGGETAFVVLDALGHPTLHVDGRLGPLTVRARLGDGRHAGMAVVTKGGSSGDDDLLERIVASLDGNEGA